MPTSLSRWQILLQTQINLAESPSKSKYLRCNSAVPETFFVGMSHLFASSLRTTASTRSNLFRFADRFMQLSLTETVKTRYNGGKIQLSFPSTMMIISPLVLLRSGFEWSCIENERGWKRFFVLYFVESTRDCYLKRGMLGEWYH